jgi:hypothetical protein
MDTNPPRPSRLQRSPDVPGYPLLVELSFGQWCVLDELFDELLLLDELVLGVAVAFVAARAWPTPTPPRRALVATVTATAALRKVGAIAITSLLRIDPPGPSRRAGWGDEVVERGPAHRLRGEVLLDPRGDLRAGAGSAAQSPLGRSFRRS